MKVEEFSQVDLASVFAILSSFIDLIHQSSDSPIKSVQFNDLV